MTTFVLLTTILFVTAIGTNASWNDPMDEFDMKISRLMNVHEEDLIKRVKRGLPRLRELFQPRRNLPPRQRKGNGINVAISFPFDSFKEVLVNLAPFGSLGVLTYSAVRDVQMQRQLDGYTSRVEALEKLNPAAIRERLNGICTTVNSLTSAKACMDDGVTCQETIDMDTSTNPTGAGADRDVGRNYMAALMGVQNPNC